MATVANLQVQIGATIKGLEGSLNKAESSLDKFAKKATAIGATLSKTLTAPLVGFGAASLFAFTKQEDAERKLSAAIRATGGEVERNMTRFKSFASEMQRVTRVGDETALSLLQVATAQGLSADSAERATRNAIAMESAFGVNADSAIRMTAALENGDATMLRRYIPALKGIEDNALAVAKAHEILNGAFDIAKADAQTTSGQIQQLRNAFGDLMEQIGGVIAEAILPFVDKLKQAVKFMQSADKQTIKLVVTIGAIAAAIGPVVLGFAGLAKVLAIVTKAFAVLVSPLALKVALIAAVGVAINTLIHNLQPLADRFVYYFAIAKNAVLDMSTSTIKALGELVMYVDKVAGAALIGLAVSLQTFKDEIPNESDLAQFISPLDALGGTFTMLTDKVKHFLFGVDETTTRLGDLKNAAESIGDMQTGAFKFSGTPIERRQLGPQGELKQRRVDADRYANSMGALGSKIKQVKVQTVDLNFVTEQMSGAFEFLSGIADQFTASFGAGMANVIVQGEKLQDVLKNIGKLLLSAAIQKGISLLLTGGLASAGTGFFGSGGGLFGKLFGGTTKVNDAMITSTGRVIEFSPKDNILAMQDFGHLKSSSGGVQSIRVSVDDIRLSGSDILIAFKNAERSFR